MNTLRRIDKALYNLEVVCLVILLGTMLVLAFGQVILRNVFSSGFVWADTVVRHLVMWLGFIGGALATADERHIGIDALTKYIPPSARRVSAIITNLFASAACGYLARISLTFLIDEKAAGTELVLSLPTWVVLIILPAGYGAVGFHFAVKAVEKIGELVTRKKEGSTG